MASQNQSSFIIISALYSLYKKSVPPGPWFYIRQHWTQDYKTSREDFRTRDTHPSLVEDSKNVRAVDTALDVTSSGSPVHCSVPALAPVHRATG